MIPSPDTPAVQPTLANLLVVDDEANIRDLLAAALRFAGFAVTTASNGNEALTLVREERPDLIVLDVMMPDMDGFTVTRRLRARGDDMPVLFLTARADPKDAVSGLTAGDRKSTRLNSSHVAISYAGFCWKKKLRSYDCSFDWS